jgi:hypothetical protein
VLLFCVFKIVPLAFLVSFFEAIKHSPLFQNYSSLNGYFKTTVR